MVSVEKTDKFYRIRVREPSSFKAGTFKTQDIGRNTTSHIDYTGRIAGILKSNNKYATQSYLVARFHPTGKLRGVREVWRDVKRLVSKAKMETAMGGSGKGWHGQSKRHSLAVKRRIRRKRR